MIFPTESGVVSFGKNFFRRFLPDLFVWDETKKGSSLVIENSGKTVRCNGNINFQAGNVVGIEGFSKGTHEWILEFGFSDSNSKKSSNEKWSIELVCS